MVGNKVDLDAEGLRAVERKDALEKKDDYDIFDFTETNARDKTHVDGLFDKIRDKLVTDIKAAS